MRTIIFAAAAVMGMTGIAFADEAKGPSVLTDAQMDMVVAGDLTLPNGHVVFSGFDNAAPGDWHPGLASALGKRNSRADTASGGNEGPWSAHFNSGGVIVCNDC